MSEWYDKHNGNDPSDPGLPYDEAPMMNPFFGQPEDAFDLINKYGTYNIQPTNEQENMFPAIAQALPKRWRETEIDKEDLGNFGE